MHCNQCWEIEMEKAEKLYESSRLDNMRLDKHVGAIQNMYDELIRCRQ